jgi:hypothetical protein
MSNQGLIGETEARLQVSLRWEIAVVLSEFPVGDGVPL